MPPVCSYYLCNNTHSLIPMFRFPTKDPKRLQVWINNCGNPRLKELPLSMLRNKHLCLNHFDKKYICYGRKSRLSRLAVPTYYTEICSVYTDVDSVVRAWRPNRVTSSVPTNVESAAQAMPPSGVTRSVPTNVESAEQARRPSGVTCSCSGHTNVESASQAQKLPEIPKLTAWHISDEPYKSPSHTIFASALQVQESPDIPRPPQIRVYPGARKKIKKEPEESSQIDMEADPLRWTPSDVDAQNNKNITDTGQCPLCSTQRDPITTNHEDLTNSQTNPAKRVNRNIDSPECKKIKDKFPLCSTQRDPNTPINEDLTNPQTTPPNGVNRNFDSPECKKLKDNFPLCSTQRDPNTPNHEDLTNPQTTPSKRVKRNVDSPEYKKLKLSLRISNEIIKRLRSSNARLKNRIGNKKLIDLNRVKFKSETSKMFTMMQIKKKHMWREEEKKFSLSLYNKSPACYKFMLKSGLVLPGVTTVNNWLNKQSIDPPD